MNCNLGIYQTTAILLLTAIGLSCSANSDTDAIIRELNLLHVYDIDVKEPSGLAIDVSGNFLWTVSDLSGGHIYKIGFDGELLAVLPYEGDDMEGITMNPVDKTLWIAEESLRQAVQLDTLGNVLQVVDLPIETNQGNDGPEGIAINPLNNHLYILNEKSPRVFLEMDDEMNVVRYEEIDFEQPYRLRDLSGLFFDDAKQEFWIVSDESEKIVITDHDLNPKKYFNLDREKFEGIAVDLSSNILYLINDEEDRLYVYQILN